MNEALIVLEQVFILILLMFIGFASVKLKIMELDWYVGVGKFTIYVALPALIFKVITTLGGRSVLLEGKMAVVISVVVIFINFAIGKFVGKISKLEGPTLDTHQSATAMGNLGYIGIPMIAALYSNMGLVVVAIYMIFDLMFNWTMGINFMDQNKNQTREELMRSLITPLNVTLVISLVFLMLNITPSGTVFEVISGLGATTKYLSIAYLGAMLTVVDFSGSHKQLSLYTHAAIKLIAFPVLIYVVAVQFVDPVIAKTFAIIMALPTMPSFPIFATLKGGDHHYAVKITFVGTLTSLVTIPVVTWIMAYI